MDLFSWKKGVWNLLKVLVSLSCIAFIYFQIRSNGDLWKPTLFPHGFFAILPLLLVLMFINWYFEVYRWKVSIESFEKITTSEAWVDVLGGLAMNWVMPFTSGDFLIRLSAKWDRYQATSAIMLNRMIMLVLTLFFGAYGIMVFGKVNVDFPVYLLTLFLLIPILARKWLWKFFKYFEGLGFRTLLKVGLLSIVRYAVFVIQFLLILYLFLPNLGIPTLLAGVGWIFFFRSIVPSILGGIGLREASAFFFFQSYVSDLSLVIMPVTIIWLINTVIPSIGGSLLIWKLRFNIAQ